MDLQINDLVLFEVEKEFGRFSFLESINETKNDEYSTESFCISKDLKLISKDLKLTPFKNSPF